MILECKHCKSPILIVGDVDPGEVSCPDCSGQGTLRPVKMDRHKKPDPPTSWAEDAAEAMEDEAWEFGDSSAFASVRPFADADQLSIVYNDDIWDSRPREHVKPEKRARALYRFPARTCACGVVFDPSGSRDVRCKACSDSYREARRIVHNQDNKARYKRKKECLMTP